MHHVTGEFDVLLKMKTKNIEFLEDNLTNIFNIKGVIRTQTMICLSSYESGFKMFDKKEEVEKT